MERWLLMIHFLSIRIYHQKVTMFMYGHIGSQTLLYWHLVFRGEELCSICRRLCSGLCLQRPRGFWAPCSALTLLHSCRCSVQIHWVNKEVKFSNNRQTCYIRPCHSVDEIFLKDVNFLLLSFSSLFPRISETQIKDQPPFKTFYVSSTKGRKSQFQVAHILHGIFKVNDW